MPAPTTIIHRPWVSAQPCSANIGLEERASERLSGHYQGSNVRKELRDPSNTKEETRGV